MQLSLSSTDPGHVTSHVLKEFIFEAQSGDMQETNFIKLHL
jgi:hypothetical protein